MSEEKMEVLHQDLVPKPDNAIIWRDDLLHLLDQRVLPDREEFLTLESCDETAEAIRDMVVRGAPAIGITAAYAVVLAAREAFQASGANWKTVMMPAVGRLAVSRPTAVNLRWAISRMDKLIRGMGPQNPTDELLAEAKAIHREDIAANKRMGDLGAALIEGPTTVITHCNAGALATGGYGTALGVIRSAHAAGKISGVLADETRPWFQGSRLTAWELKQDGIPVRLMVEGAAASRMLRGDIGWIIVGSDRIAANGDVANKIGTYGLAVAARHHGVKVMVAAPTTTIDMSIASGDQIPIEFRDENEVLNCGANRMGTRGVGAWNPVFDLTPAGLVDVIVTERGVIHSPNRKKLERLMADSSQAA